MKKVLKVYVSSLMMLLLFGAEAFAVHYVYAGNKNTCWHEDWRIVLLLFAVFVLSILAVWFAMRVKVVAKQSKINELTDPLTKVGNLAHFKNYYENAIFDYSRSKYFVAYIIVDGNHVRNCYGNTAFDDVMVYASEVISTACDDVEEVARITETGFAVVFRTVGIETAEEQMKLVISKLNRYADSGDNSKPVFYVALYNFTGADNACELVLFNLRLNCSKIMGSTSQLVVCDSNLMKGSESEKEVMAKLDSAMRNREFELYLQFIVENKKKNIVSAEALARWNSPTEGILGPGSFIPQLESVGFICKFDYYMFELVCEQLEKWNSTEFGRFSLSCNFTRITISEEDFVRKIKDIAERYNFDRSRLIIEITEDAMERSREVAMSNMKKCKQLGFRIALDDMGCGYTSLINLCEYPIDIVKIDRDILLKTDKPNGKKLFAGMIALAHKLGLAVVCEGVETKEQNEFVDNSECDYVQGWYYSRVISTQACEDFIRNYEKSSVIVTE